MMTDDISVHIVGKNSLIVIILEDISDATEGVSGAAFATRLSSRKPQEQNTKSVTLLERITRAHLISILTMPIITVSQVGYVRDFRLLILHVFETDYCHLNE